LVVTTVAIIRVIIIIEVNIDLSFIAITAVVLALLNQILIASYCLNLIFINHYLFKAVHHNLYSFDID